MTWKHKITRMECLKEQVSLLRDQKICEGQDDFKVLEEMIDSKVAKRIEQYLANKYKEMEDSEDEDYGLADTCSVNNGRKKQVFCHIHLMRMKMRVH